MLSTTESRSSRNVGLVQTRNGRVPADLDEKGLSMLRRDCSGHEAEWQESPGSDAIRMQSSGSACLLSLGAYKSSARCDKPVPLPKTSKCRAQSRAFTSGRLR